MAGSAGTRKHTRGFSICKTDSLGRKSQAKPLFAIIISIVILSYAVFAEGIGAPVNESSNITKQITKIVDFVFGAFGISARLALQNNTPVENQEILFYSNGSRISGGITDSGGIASINYSPAPGTYDIFASFNGTEYLYPSNISQTVIAENASGPEESESSADLCIGITCENLCDGTSLLKNGYCKNETGGCEYEVAENSSECGYSEPIAVIPAINRIIGVVLSSLSVIKGEILTISARLSYENNTPIQNEELLFYEDSVYLGSNMTDESGVARLSVNTSGSSAGNHTINATHNGTWNASVVEIIGENATYDDEDAVQGVAEIGIPVAWTKRISVRNNKNHAATLKIGILIDGMAQDIEIKDNSGKTIGQKQMGLGAMSVHGKQEIEFDGALLPLEEKEYEVAYSTPGPEKSEGENRTDGKKWRKNVTIFSDYSYTNVLAYTDISETDTKQIHLFWNINGSLTDVTEDPTLNLTYVDTNGNGKIDMIYWTVPHLSEQQFEIVIDLTIINVQSYPAVGGNWTVRFNTTGTANLTISAIDGTAWSDENEDKDLRFLEMKCGAENVAAVWTNDSVFVENYACNETSYETSKVLTSGKHHLKFQFGDDVGYANNMAGCTLACDSTTADTCIISTAREVLTDCYIDDGVVGKANIEIQSGGSIYNYTNNASFAINVTGNITIKSGGKIVGNVNISAVNLTIDSGGLINATGYGYGNASGPGAGISGPGGASGTGYGSITEPTDFGSGGGSFASIPGGSGGGFIKINVSGTLTNNGNITSNGTAGNYYGTGGGNMPGSGGYGGDGGNGAALGTCSNSYYSGVGSGGGIYIVAGTFAGNGYISASGSKASATNCGGGGGGGRIAIYYTTKTYTGTLIAYGGWRGTYATKGTGGAGTIYFKQSDAPNGALILDNNNGLGNLTRLNETRTFDNITLIKGANAFITSGTNVILNYSSTWNISGSLTINGSLNIDNTTNFIIENGSTVTVIGILNASKVTNITINGIFAASNDTTTILTSLKNLTINNGGTLTHSANNDSKTYYINLTLENLVINSGGSINATGKGYAGGGVNINGNGPGAGHAAACGAGGGASYGGLGGDSSCTGDQAGSPYGSITEQNDLGSGGAGGAVAGLGGSGGGRIILNVSSTLTDEGSIIADGTNAGPTYASGGGSGGAIYISTATITGTGTISANGGTGTANGGGGGGGRIAVYYTTNTYSGTITAYGNSAPRQSSGAGTVFQKSSSQTYGDLTIDTNSNANKTVTPLNSSAYSTAFDTLTIRNNATVSSNLTTLPLNVTTLTGNGTINVSSNNLVLRITNISMPDGSISSTSGDINITFTSSINASNFNAEFSTARFVRIDYNSIALSTGFTAQNKIARTFNSWSNQQMKWNDTNQSGVFDAYYNVTGLLANTQYLVYNTSLGSTANPYSLTTDSNGALNFNISLNDNTEIRLATQNYALCSGICDVGSDGDTCLIGSPKSTYSGCYIDDVVLGGYNSIIINGTGSVYNNTNNASFAINITGNLTIKNGGNITGNVNITAVNLTIESGGLINASGRGYAGVASANGLGPGGGIGSSGFSGAGGGGYGGYGGVGFTYAGGSYYGNPLAPNDFGSGGGGYSGVAGGNGGGLIILNVTNIVVDGNITANGISGISGTYPGGGAGGGIFINTTTFSGAGSINAIGGSGSSSSGGGGAGGRIAAHYNSKTYTGAFNAYGGLGWVGSKYGGAGTIFQKSSSQTYGDLIIDNNGNSNGTLTPLNSSAYSTAFDTLTIQNNANVSSAVSPLPLNATTITGNGMLYLGTNSISIKTSNLSMNGGNITSTTGQINITFPNNLNTSNFAGKISTSSGAINIWYGAGTPQDRCDNSGTTISGATPSYYYAPWSNTTAYRCVRSIIMEAVFIDSSNSSRTQFNAEEQFYPSVRIREYDGSTYYNVSGSWNMTTYNSNGSVPNSTLLMTNVSGNYIWRNESWSESTLASYSFYANITGISGVGMVNTSTGNLHSYSVKSITVTDNLNVSPANPAELINLSGIATLMPDVTGVTDTNVSIYINGTFQGNATTNSNGNYNYTITSPMAAGNHTLKVNITDSNGIYGENSTNLTVKINLSSPSAKGITTGTSSININEIVNVSVIIPTSNINYPTLNLSKVWANISNTTWSQIYFLSGNVSGGTWWNNTFSSSSIGQYNVTFYANLTNGFATTTATNATFTVQQIIITETLIPSTANPGDAVTVNGRATLQPDGTNVTNNNVNIYLDGQQLTSATWWNNSWPYRKAITINGSNVSLSDHQINFTINYAAGMNSSFQDIRFTYYNSTSLNETEIPYWIENYTLSVNATVWIKANMTTGNNTVYLYYGNSSATYNNTLGGNNTFVFFDDFANTLKWTGAGTYSTNNVGNITAYSVSGTAISTLNTTSAIGDGTFWVMLKIKQNGTSSGGDSSYTHKLIQQNNSGDTDLDTTEYLSWTTKNYLLSGTNIRLKGYVSAYGVTQDMGGSCSGCNPGWDAGCDTICPAGNEGDCTYCGGSWGQSYNYYPANVNLEMDDVLIRKYAALQPYALSFGENEISTLTNSTGGYTYTFTIPSSTKAGSHIMKVNLTDANGIIGTNTTNLIVGINLANPNANATILGGTLANVDEPMNISVSITNIDYPTLNLSKVWANISNTTWSQIYFLSGNVSGGVWWNATFSSATLGQYNVTFHANLTDGFNTTTASNATFNIKQLNITYAINDTIIYATENALINGTIYLEPEHAVSGTTPINITLNSGSTDTGGKITDGSGRYNFTYTPAAVTSITTINFTLNATDPNGINGTTTNSSAITVYPAIAVDTWASTTSACADRTTDFNSTGAIFLCANVTYSSVPGEGGESARFTVYKTGVNNENSANPVFNITNTTTANIAYTSITPNESSRYTLNVTAWNSNINPSVTAIDNFTFEFGQLNISSVAYDGTIYTTENSTISGLLRDFMNVSWFNNDTAAFVNITAASGTFNANSSFVNSSGEFNFTYTPNSSLATKTTVTLNINATYGNITGNWTGTLDIYPQIAVDTWASSSSSCASRDTSFNITAQKYLCANITYGTNNTAGAYVNFSVSDIGSYSYGAANPVFTNNSIYDSGTIVSSPVSLNESIKYRITATSWNPSVNAAATAEDTYEFIYGALNITASLNDTIVMPNSNISLFGSLFDYLNSSWVRTNSSVNIYLDEVLLTNGGIYNKTWNTNANFSNGTSVNVTNSSNSLVLDPRGQYYFEAESAFDNSSTYINQTNENPAWDGDPSGSMYIGGSVPLWANYNITGIPNGTYYIFVKMRMFAATYMVNVTWDGAYINTTQRSAGYSNDILWSDSLATPVVVNSTSHILGFNSTTNAPAIDVFLLTANASFAPDNTDQNYTSTPLKYRGNFVSNKTTADYAIISITPNWTSNEPAGTNITIDISADNGASWCSNVTKREYRSGCGIGSGTELVWRANLSANNSFALLRLESVNMSYETGNFTKTNSSGDYAFNFNAGSTLGWHTVKVNATDSNGIYGNISTTYLIDGISIVADTTPNVVDVDTLSETITITINSSTTRSGARKNITATIIKPDSSQEIIENSSFSCGTNYPMTCTAPWAPGATQPQGFYNVTIAFEDNESITGTNTIYNDFKVDNITTTLSYLPTIPILSTQNITVSGQANYTYDGSAVANNSINIFLDGQQLVSWWSTSWQYRKAIMINGSTTEQADYQVIVNLTSSNFNFSRANSQGNDTRFTWINTTSGLEQNISFWIENWTSSGANGNATIWVSVPNITASNIANTTLYMYYSNPSATYNKSLSGNSTFVFFDDFTGGSTQWTGSGTTGVIGEGNASASKTGTGTVTSNLTSDIIGSGNFKTTLRVKNSISLGTGTSGDYKIQQVNSSETTDLYKYGTDDNTNYVSKTYSLFGTNVQLRLYALATGDTSSGSSAYCDGGGICDGYTSPPDPIECNAHTEEPCWWVNEVPPTDYTATSAIYVDDVYVSKYASPEPSVLSLGAEQAATTTNSTGGYNYTFAAPAQIGTHTLNINLTDANGISGENSTQIEVWAPTIVNGTSSDYVLDIDHGSFNITGYFWRADVLSAIPGEMNITINGYTQTCTSATSCQKTFTLGPGQNISSTGTYAVTINASNNSAYYMPNSTQFNIIVENITTTLYTNKSQYFIGEAILINGTAQQSVNGLMASGTLDMTIDGNNCGTPAWMNSGKWNTTCTFSSGTYSSNLGPATILANITNQTEWIYGANSTTIEIWAPSIVNYTNATNYSGTNTEYNITGYYWRTDTAAEIPGAINITIFNSTNSTSKSCSSASSCLQTFTIGPSGELRGGNYTAQINASNNSAYYSANSTLYNIYLEEPKATGTLEAPIKVIGNLQQGVDYNFTWTVSINNTNASTMITPRIDEVINYISCTDIKAVVNSTPKDCSYNTPGSACAVQFNITVSGNAPQGPIGCLSWTSNWTNNDNTVSTATNAAFYIQVSGNPQMNASLSIINITDNIGYTNITLVTVNNTGNERLGDNGQPANSIFVDLINNTLPASWVSFRSTAGVWDDTNDYWDYLNAPGNHILNVTVLAANYTAGTYTGIINITSYASGALQAFKEINISMTISPNISISQNLINHTQLIGAPNLTNITIQSNGNSPITNITVTYIAESMPALWINFSSQDSSWNATSASFDRITEYTNKTLRVNITALNYTPGTYTGKINITINENLDRLINVTITVAPAISVNISKINITQNISSANTTLILISSTGNAPITNVTVALVNSTIPQSWMSVGSDAGDWNSGTQSFSRIDETTDRTINVTIKSTNYTEGVYTGILNITSNEQQNTQINLSINITPAAATYNIDKADEHGQTTALYHIINSTGNALLVNATATYIESTLPASWVTLNYSGQTGQSVTAGNITEGSYRNITVEITIPQYQAPGNYVGYINTTFDNEPTQQISVTLTVNTNSSWHIQDPVNKSNTFVLGDAGIIGNVTVVNTGNVPLNYTVNYTYNDICKGYGAAPKYCATGASAEYNLEYLYVAKNSSETFGIWQKGSTSTRYGADILVNVSNSSGTPVDSLANMSWDIINSPPILVNLTTLPKNYTELNKSITLYAIISDDEDIGVSTGFNMSTVYFNVTNPSAYTYTIDNESIYAWDDNDHVGDEADRKKFNYSFTNTSLEGIHNLTVYIKDKSNNGLNLTTFQFEVIGATAINITASTPSAAANVTSLHGENLTIPINITNLGRATAYNVTVTGIFASGIAWNRTFSELNESQEIQTNITLEVSTGTALGSYQLMPKVTWTHPNASSAENITAYNITISVSSNPELTLPAIATESFNHGEGKTITIDANSTGNDNYLTPKAYISAGSAPANWSCFNNYCASGGTATKTYADISANDSSSIIVYTTVPSGTIPGNYTFYVTMNSTSYGAERSKTANMTINVLEDRTWTYLQPFNTSSFELNTPGTIGIITLNGSGNTETNFTINYTNWSDSDYHSYTGLINESQNNSGTIVNPKSVILAPNELRNITIYQNGYFQGAGNIGINITITNSSASPSILSVLMLFNLTETAPNITAITFFNASSVELNKTIGIKVHSRDDASLNLSTIMLNITSPIGTAYMVTPDTTTENTTANGKYTRMNFTYLFNSTSAAGTYTVNASVFDEYGYSAQSLQYTFEVIGSTDMNLSANATSYNSSGITQSVGINITLSINATNTGSVVAYDANITGNFSANASTWTVFNVSLGNISASAVSAANLTLYIPAATWPGTYYFTPGITWKQPNGSSTQYISSPVSIVVASNKTAVFTEYALNFTIGHGATNSTVIRINSTGNDNATSIILYKQSVPSNLTVSLNQTSITSITAGDSKYVVLNITPASGTPNGTYAFDIELDNDGGVSGTYHYGVIIPPSFSWSKNANETTVNGVSGQNAIDTSVNITNTGNNPMSFTLSLAGNITDASIMNLLETSKALQPLQTYSIQLNHTAKDENAYYEGTLQINNGSGAQSVTVKYYSYMAEMNITGISPNYDVLSGSSVNVTTQLLFGGNNITENTTYVIEINGTACAITQNVSLGGYIVHTCTAPSISDGNYYDVRVDAEYLFSTGIVPLSVTNASAIYYKDVTAPTISSHTITTEQEILYNVTINLTLNDNIQMSGALAEIKYPNGTAYENLTLSNTSAANYSGIFAAPPTIGAYTARYYVNDTTGNVNSSVTDSFDIYEWKNFSGIVQDLNSNPVSVSFNVTNSSASIIAQFQTNSSGNYNATLKKKTYNLRMSILNSTIAIDDVDFEALPADFVDVDQPLTGDYGYNGNVIKGFAMNTSVGPSGNITMTYTSAEAAGHTTDYFQIYQCVLWDYENRNCLGGLSKLTGSHDKINRRITAPFSNTSTFILVEDQPVTRPEMTISASTLPITAEHGNTGMSLMTIQSTGTVALSDIQFTCSSGTVCTNFSVGVSSIIGLDAGATYDAPVNVTVPKYTANGTYEGTLIVESNTLSVYAQYKAITLRVTVPEDNNWTSTSNLTVNSIGSGTSGILGNIELKNFANVPVSFVITPNSSAVLSATPTEVTVQKSVATNISINYTTPEAVGAYNYSVNITGTAGSRINETATYISFNVTHAVNMTDVQPNTNISVGEILTINATASYLGIEQTENVSWAVYVDSTLCENTIGTYNSTKWTVTCEAPNMSAKLSYTLTLKGTFLNYSNLVAFDWAYDMDNIYYVDAIAPVIANYTTSSASIGANTTINASLLDYSNVTNTTVIIIAPNGSTLSIVNMTKISNVEYSFSYNFTEIGDYILRYSLSDELNNSELLDRYFEVYRNVTFSGKVAQADSSGLETTFKLYRQNQNYSSEHIIHQFSTDSEGSYNKSIHDREYDLEISEGGNTIKLYDANMTNYLSDPIDIDPVSGNEVQITGTTELSGIGVNTSIVASGRITVAYSPTDSTKEDNIYLYKCADWNFTEARCTGDWVQIERISGDLDKINNKISTDISGFSAYVAAEITPPIPVSVSVTTTSSGGGGGGGGSEGGVKTIVESISSKLTSFVESAAGIGVDTSTIAKQLYPGEKAVVSVEIKNTLNETRTIILSSEGEVSKYLSFDPAEYTLERAKSSTFTITMAIPKTAYPGLYEGKIAVSNGKQGTNIPISIRVLDALNLPVSLDVQPLVDEIAPGATMRVKLNIYNKGVSEIPVNYTLSIIDPDSNLVVSVINGSTFVLSSESAYLNITIPENITLESAPLSGINQVKTKRYMVKAAAVYDLDGRPAEADAVAFVSITKKTDFLRAKVLGIPAWSYIIILAMIIASYFAIRRYMVWTSSKKKYVETIEFKTLPQAGERAGFIGKIAETDIRAFIDVDTLQTHTILAGATGGGKTIAAQVIVEEALLKGAAVIVFDPTAQWSGFLRPNRDKKMLKTYRQYDMKVDDSRAFNGNIYEIRDARQIIDITQHMTPGQITIFTMNHLDTKDIDFFVANSVSQVFQANLDGSQKLKLLLVYDEVHRLLEKYGGTGNGFMQIERAVREFRKWGIGLVLISQVLSDFIGTIKANIGTDIQLRTRDESDLDRIKMKYGEDMMRSVVKASVGEAMFENAQYNKGKPYFVAFRPIIHSTDRLPDAELEKYSKYNARIDDLKYQLECLKSKTIDVFDLELELKLAGEKLMKGNFNMVDIYIDELEPKVAALWKKLGVEPKRKEVFYATRAEIEKDVAAAKKEHEAYVIKEKRDEEQNAKSLEKAGSKPAAYDSKHGKKEVESTHAATAHNPHSHETKTEKSGAKDVKQEARHSSGTAGTSAKPTRVESAKNEAMELYDRLKEKLDESRKKGKDVTVESMKAMSIPADIKLAAVDESVEEIEKIKGKIGAMIKRL